MLHLMHTFHFKEKKNDVIVLHRKQRCKNLHGKSIFSIFVNDLKRARNDVLHKCGN